MRKLLLLMIMTVLSMTVLVGCGGEEESTSSESDPLQFMISTDTAEQAAAYEELCAGFTEETGIEVEIINVPNSDYAMKLSNMVAAGDAPDVCKFTGVDAAFVEDVLDLTPIYEMYAFNSPAMQNSSEGADGPVTGLPFANTVNGMIINTDLWDQAGVDYPAIGEPVWTWDEFLACLEEVIANSDAKYGLVFDKSEERIRSYFSQWGVDTVVLDENGELIGTEYGSQACEDAIQYFVDMNDDVIMPTSVWLSGEDASTLFKSGQVAAHYSGSWRVADYMETVAFNWAVVPMPIGTERAAADGGDVIFAFDGPQNEESLQFIEYIYSEEPYEALVGTIGGFPVIDGYEPVYAEGSEEYYAVFQDEYENACPESQAEDAYGATVPADPNAPTVTGVVRDNIVLAINGDITVEEANKAIGEKFTEVFGVPIVEPVQ